MEMDTETDQRALDKALIKHCSELQKEAALKHPAKQFESYENYYKGVFDAAQNPNLTNSYNIIKALVEAKTTFILDAQITTSVMPSMVGFAEPDALQDIYDVADIMQECLNHVLKINTFDLLQTKIVRRAEKTGIGICKINWDADKSKGIGDVCITEINPINWFPDPNAKTIEECNYIVLRTSYSIFDLKAKYPDRIEDIDQLAKKSKDEKSDEKKPKSNSDAPIVNTQSTQSSSQLYATTNGFDPNKVKQTIEVWECYLKDDTTLPPDSGDSTADEQKKAELRFQYPFGRVVIYAGEDVVFEDKPLDYKYGFPFDKFNLLETDSMWGQGDVEDLMAVQDRLNIAQHRRRILIAKYVSILLNDPLRTGINNENSFVNSFVLNLKNGGTPGTEPLQVVTNNTLSEIENITAYINELKKEAKEIVGVNEMMLSGERPTGVNSGAMLDSLTESAMSRIRGIQRGYKEFLISLSNKCLSLVRDFYTTPRMIRITAGKEFLVLPARANVNLSPGAPPEQQLPIRKMGTQTGDDGKKLTVLIDEIKGDLSISDYETEIVAGSEMPRSRVANAELAMKLYDADVLGDKTDIDVKEWVLRGLDFPNYRAIVSRMRDKEDELKNAPPPTPASLVDKIDVNLKDFPVIAEYAFKQMGVPEDVIHAQLTQKMTPPAPPAQKMPSPA